MSFADLPDSHSLASWLGPLRLRTRSLEVARDLPTAYHERMPSSAATPSGPAPPPFAHRLAIFRADARPLLALAGPVVLAELGWMAMGLVDTIMVGPLGPAAIGAVGLGASLFMAVAIFGMGLLLGLDTLVSQAFGAGRIDECRRWLAHGLVVGLGVGLPLSAWCGGDLPAGARRVPSRRRTPDRSVRADCHVQPAAADGLRGLPAVPAGDGARASDLDRARDGEPRERGRQLDADLRPARHARARHRWCGLGDRHLATLHGARPGGHRRHGEP
jgi:hypothetical protein